MKTWHIKVKGVVQGVGFRPFVFRLAEKFALKGFVTNSSHGVEIQINCDKETVKAFSDALLKECPPLANIISVTFDKTDHHAYSAFTIEPSKATQGVTLVPPDTALCPDCAAEITDPENRRFGYPFTNCTNCGPRYSIIKSLPYDRKKTTMSTFSMCPECQKEYDNPSDRRFHAQPNACQVCGPMVYMGSSAGAEAVRKAAEIIDSGGIVVVKGLGGYHLVCDAAQDIPVKTLRNIKNRPDKPLAVMCTKETLLTFAEDGPEVKLFSSPQAPITIINAPDAPISRYANPMSDNIGFLAPYTPLHRVLLEACRTDFLIATSGNRKDEPIAKDDRQAEKSLSDFTSHFLHHTRPIHNRVDDSLAAVVQGVPYIMRRARGFAPYPVMLPSAVTGCVLAVGAHLKNSVTIAQDRYAFVSQYTGDLDNPDTCAFFEETVEKMKSLFGLEPDRAVCDLHPGYHSTKYALETGLPVQKVQHHIAHMMACMAENGLKDDVLGVVLDGTGLGTDETIWGGEFLLMKDRKITRAAHLPKVMQPGMDSAAKNPGRMLISYLHSFGLLDQFKNVLVSKLYIPEKDIKLTASMIDRSINCIPTTSAGRLFESLGAAVTGITKNLFEAHAAMKLEGAASRFKRGDGPDFDICSENFFPNLFTYALKSLENEEKTNHTAYYIQCALADRLIHTIKSICSKEGIEDVVLSGGVFQNLYITGRLSEIKGLKVHRHRSVPANDSCISLGQAYYTTFSKVRSITKV